VDGNGRFDPPGLPPAPMSIPAAAWGAAAVVGLAALALALRRRRG
jgi:hypothetical protein